MKLVIYRLFPFSDSLINFANFCKIERLFTDSSITRILITCSKGYAMASTSDLSIFNDVFITPYNNDLSSISAFLRIYGLPARLSCLAFITSGCFGPFLTDISSLKQSRHWIDTKVMPILLQDADLVFPIVEIPYYRDLHGSAVIKDPKCILKGTKSVPFGHTYAFFLNNQASQALLSEKILPNVDIDKDDAILKYERLFTSHYLNEGFRIKGLNNPAFDYNDSRYWDSRLFSVGPFEPSDPEAYVAEGISISNTLALELSDILFVKNIRHSHKHRPDAFSGTSSYLRQSYYKFTSTLSDLL